MKHIVLLVILLVNGCANRDQTSEQPVKKAKVTMIVALEEVIAFDVDANAVVTASEVGAIFIKASADTKRSLRAFSSGRAKGPQCEAISESLAASQTEVVTGGKLEFSPLNESTLFEIPEDAESHRYQRALTGAIPDGYYQILGHGTDLVPSFRAMLSMPGRVESPRLNDTALTDRLAAIKKSEPVTLTWRAPSFGSDRNILIATLRGKTETERVMIECLALERELIGSTGDGSWTLPKVYVQQLPTTTDASIAFSRAHIEIPEKLENLEADLEGFRTHATRLLVGE